MRYYSNVAGQTTVTAGVTSADTVIPLASVTGLPSSYPFTLAVDVGTASEEVVTVTNVIGLNATVVRGEDGTAAVAHAAGAVVRHVLSARDLREPQEHIIATSGVHGVGTGSVTSTNAAQTLTNKTVSGLFNTLSDIPKAAVAADTVYTADAQTLTNKTVSGATNTLTDIPKAAVAADTVYTADAQTLTNKTVSGATNTLTDIADASITGLAVSKLIGDVAKSQLPADTVYTANLPRIATGETAYVFAGTASLNQTITFPANRFTVAPIVAATLRTGAVTVVPHISAPATTTGVGIRVDTVDGVALTGTLYLHWIAIQEA